MLSTYCGSFTQRGFKRHIAECGVCWNDAQSRDDLDFDPASVPKPDEKNTQPETDRGATMNATIKPADMDARDFYGFQVEARKETVAPEHFETLKRLLLVVFASLLFGGFIGYLAMIGNTIKH